MIHRAWSPAVFLISTGWNPNTPSFQHRLESKHPVIPALAGILTPPSFQRRLESIPLALLIFWCNGFLFKPGMTMQITKLSLVAKTPRHTPFQRRLESIPHCWSRHKHVQEDNHLAFAETTKSATLTTSTKMTNPTRKTKEVGTTQSFAE